MTSAFFSPSTLVLERFHSVAPDIDVRTHGTYIHEAAAGLLNRILVWAIVRQTAPIISTSQPEAFLALNDRPSRSQRDNLPRDHVQATA